MIKWVLVLATCAIAQQTYDNVGLNAHFEVPAGWALETPDTTSYGVHLQVTRVGLKPVNIYLEKYDNAYEAALDRQAFGFFEMTAFYKRTESSTVAPIAPYLQDSLYSSGISLSGLNMRHVALDKHLVCYMTSFKIHMHSFCYETTMSDFDTNHELYLKNWLGLSFINTSTTSAKLSAQTINQANEKKIFIDALGRKSGVNAPRIPQFLTPR